VLSLRNMLDDIASWGWAEAPGRRLVFAADVPRLDQPLPRALPPDVDAAIMNAVTGLEDDFARIGLTVLRGAGLRVGELPDLEVGSIVDYGPAGIWLKVPLGKPATERMVPLDTATLAALDEWARHRGTHRPVPHPRTGTLTDFLFTQHGRRLGCDPAPQWPADRRPCRRTARTGRPHPRRDLPSATSHLGNRAGQRRHEPASPDGSARHPADDDPLRHPGIPDPAHRLRRGHGQLRRQFTLTPAGRPIIPDKISWLHSEMLKTRVAHGYCSRHQAAGACPYANICETCDNFVTGPEFAPALRDQLTDVQDLHADAQSRGWDSEAARHARVINALTDHLTRLQR
jgi:hypothetical protein